MYNSTVERQERFACPQLPLAVYREVAAHLRQVEGVKTGLIQERSQQFNYQQSQIAALWIEYPADLDTRYRQQIQEILDYYAQRFGPWQREAIA